jgi:hypothetical protein
MATSEWHWEQGVKFAVEGIKTTLLINGAAAIALMTFADKHTVTNGMKWALILFALGAMVSAVAFIAAYATQLEYGNAEVPGVDRNAKWRKAQNYNKFAVALVFISVLLFVVGSFVSLLSWPTQV